MATRPRSSREGWDTRRRSRRIGATSPEPTRMRARPSRGNVPTRAQPRPSRSNRRDGEDAPRRKDPNRVSPRTTRESRHAHPRTRTYSYSHSPRRSRGGASARESIRRGARRRERRYRDEGWCDGDSRDGCGAGEARGARGAGPGSMRGHQPRERSRERSSDGEEEEEDAGWCSAETMRLARPRSISASRARARARKRADVGGWSRGVAPRGERSVRSRGSPGVAARGRRGARHGRGRRRGRAGVHVRRARIYRARLRLSLRLRVPQQQAGPVQEVLEPDDAARAKSVEVHRAGVTSLYTQQDALHHLETFRLDRIVHAAARSAFGRAASFRCGANSRPVRGRVEATA